MISHVKRAVARYGHSRPSADDILMELCPLYHTDPEHTKRYHRLFGLVVKEAQKLVFEEGGGECERCGAPKPIRRNRFCSRTCHLKSIDRTHRKIKPEIAAEIVRRAAEGERVSQIAKDLGVGRTTAYAYIREAA